MADNVIANPGAGGSTFASDDIGGVQFPRIKVVIGADGVNDGDVAAGNPLPVTGTVTANAGTGPFPVSDNGGSLTIDAASLPLPTGAATAANQLPDGHNVTVDNAAGAAAVNVQDGGNSLTVDGTVGVSGSVAVTNAALGVTGGGVEATALRVTVASDSTGVLSVDDNGGSLTVDGTVTANLAAGTNNIGDVDVLTLPAIPAGANEIGRVRITDGTTLATVRDLASNDALNVAIVDGSGAQITSFGGGTQYAEDTAHASGDIVTMAGVVQQSADAALSGDGDRSVLQVDANGYLKVNIKAGAGSGGTASTDDAAFTVGSGSGTPAMGYAAADSVDAGDVGVLRMTTARGLHAHLVDGSGSSVTVGGGVEAAALRVTIASDSTGVLSVDDNGGSLTVDGTVAISGTVDTELPAAAALADNTANPTVPAVGGFGMVWDGSTWDRQPGTSADGTLVNLGANNDVTVTGTVTANLSAGTNTNEVVGDVAHDVAAAGNPVLTAGSSETMADSAPANRVSADGDASRFSVTDGALYTIPTGPQLWSYHENSSSALTDATVHSAPGAGLSLYVQSIVVSTGAATALNVFFEESTTTVLGPYYLEAVAGRGLCINFLAPKKITANTALTITTSAAIAHGIDVTGFIAPG